MQISDAIGGVLARLFQSTSTQSSSNAQKADAAQKTPLDPSSTTPVPAGRDYTHMTSRQMQDVAKELFDAGKIDLTQLFMLQTAGVPLGKLGPNGEFVDLTPTEKSGYQNVPMNYLQLSQDAINRLEQSGQSADPKSGYKQWTGILNALRQSSSSIDVRA